MLTHLPASPLARERRWNCSELFSGRLQRRCIGGDPVTETALHVVTPIPWPSELGSVLNKDSGAKRVVIQGFRIGGGLDEEAALLAER